jgi:hypothetical protein
MCREDKSVTEKWKRGVDAPGAPQSSEKKPTKHEIHRVYYMGDILRSNILIFKGKY